MLPAFGDRRDAGIGKGGEYTLRSRSVGSELDFSGGLLLFESIGRELDEAGPELFGLLGGRGDGGADQLKMFRSLSNRPWWC